MYRFIFISSCCVCQFYCYTIRLFNVVNNRNINIFQSNIYVYLSQIQICCLQLIKNINKVLLKIHWENRILKSLKCAIAKFCLSRCHEKYILWTRAKDRLKGSSVAKCDFIKAYRFTFSILITFGDYTLRHIILETNQRQLLVIFVPKFQSSGKRFTIDCLDHCPIYLWEFLWL